MPRSRQESEPNILQNSSLVHLLHRRDGLGGGIGYLGLDVRLVAPDFVGGMAEVGWFDGFGR